MRVMLTEVELSETRGVKDSYRNKERTHDFGSVIFLMVTRLASEWFYTLMKVQDQPLFEREIIRKAEGSVYISAYVISFLRQR